MNLAKLLNDPLTNAITIGVIMYLLITISNKGNPTVGAILSSFPVGLFGLLAIQTNLIKTEYVRHAVFVNIIIVIMWIFMFVISKQLGHKQSFLLYSFIVWLFLCIFYYFYNFFFSNKL